MVFLNTTSKRFIEYVHEKRLVLFGAGRWCELSQYSFLKNVHSQIDYIVDNDVEKKQIVFCGIKRKIHSIKKLKRENNCVIVLMSPVYMYEMFSQLIGLELDDSVECFALPFILISEDNRFDNTMFNKAIGCDSNHIIPKVIHSFWFSGEDKPDIYKQCFETWKTHCPEYEIIEWNMDNYNWKKHPFMKKAIEDEAWAFASDYARLDVLSEYGGIYLDMDVELLKPLDDLLRNRGIFSYCRSGYIDLAVCAFEKEDTIIADLLSSYDSISLPERRSDYRRYFQPFFVSKRLAELGAYEDASFKIIDDVVFASPNVFMPLDYVIFKEPEIDQFTYAIHHDNFGWDIQREKKRELNRLLWDRIDREL